MCASVCALLLSNTPRSPLGQSSSPTGNHPAQAYVYTKALQLTYAGGLLWFQGVSRAIGSPSCVDERDVALLEISGVRLEGVLPRRALLFRIYIRVPDFWKLCGCNQVSSNPVQIHQARFHLNNSTNVSLQSDNLQIDGKDTEGEEVKTPQS